MDMEQQQVSIQELFDTSEPFKKVLAGAISLDDFAKTPDFERLKHLVIQQFGASENLNKLTIDGVASAWITKLRFNETMSDGVFFNYLERADAILANPKGPLNLTTENAEKNDLIAIMWGIEALSSTQGYDNGVTKVRFPSMAAGGFYDNLKLEGAKDRISTHAQLTAIGKMGLGKDVVLESHRRYTPRGTGNLLVVPTYRSDKDANKKSLQQKDDYDLLFKLESAGFKDKLLHSVLHALGPLKKLFFKIGDLALYNKKTPLARDAERACGTFSAITRKEHLSDLGKIVKRDLLNLLEEIQQNPALKDKFSEFAIVQKARMKFPFTEKKITGANGSKYPLATFLSKINAHRDDLKTEGINVSSTLQTLLNNVTTDSFSDRREGNETLVDMSTKGKSKLIEWEVPTDRMPKQKKPAKLAPAVTTPETQATATPPKISQLASSITVPIVTSQKVSEERVWKKASPTTSVNREHAMHLASLSNPTSNHLDQGSMKHYRDSLRSDRLSLASDTELSAISLDSHGIKP